MGEKWSREYAMQFLTWHLEYIAIKSDGFLVSMNVQRDISN